MHLFTWLNISALAGSQLALATALAFVLFGIRRAYPNPRGNDSFALAFAAWVPATVFLLGQGRLPLFASVIVPNLLLIFCYILMYRGVLSFFRAQGSLPLLYDVAAVAAAVVIYFSTVYDLAVPRLVAMSVLVALTRAMMAVELYRRADKRNGLVFCAGSFAFLALIPVGLATLAVMPSTLSRAASGDGASTLGALQSLNMLADLAFLAVSGLFAFSFFLSEVRATVAQQGQLDPVTGTLTGRAIEDMLAAEVARSSRTHSPVSVMLIEIDRFKAITETYGRDRGDQALCTVVSTVASILRFYDKCGRLADDRFLVLLPENTAEHAMVIAGRLREALKDPTLPAGQPAITLSIGVTQCAFKEAPVEVLTRAEVALAEVRRNGRNGESMKLPNHDDVRIPHPDRVANRSRVAKVTR